MNEELFNQILNFIVDIRGHYRKKITENSELEVDLKITGDDACEFLERYSEKFGVDIFKFNINKYFASEGTLDLYLLIFLKKKQSRKRITVGNLIRGIEAGKLDEETIGKDL